MGEIIKFVLAVIGLCILAGPLFWLIVTLIDDIVSGR